MNYNLPYYGKKGTISKVEENNKFYKVYRYDNNGKDNYLMEVPKNDKNFAKLTDNYYKDLEEYLNMNKDKYETYKLTRLKKSINPNLINSLKIASIAMIGLSIPMLSTHESLGYIGVTLDVLAIPVLLQSVNLSIKETNDNKKKKFIEQYNDLDKKLRYYNEGKSKSLELTRYSGVKNNTKEPTRDLKKVLERKKVA